MIPPGKQLFQIRRFGILTEALVPGQNPVGEIFPLGVQMLGDHVSIRPRPKSANVEFVKGGNVLEEFSRSGPKSRVVPERAVEGELEVDHVLEFY